MAKFTNKIVAVMNKSLEPGKALNALGHMCIGFGAHLGKELLHPTDYRDADGGSHPHISEMPFIILCANSNKIRGLRKQAIEKKIEFVDFTDRQLRRTIRALGEDQRRRIDLFWHRSLWPLGRSFRNDKKVFPLDITYIN